MAKSEKFNASVNFGGSIDSSLGRSLKWLTSNIQDSEKVTLKAMGVQTKWMKELQAGSASATSKLKTMEQSMGALVAKQSALEKKIRAGVRAGEDVSKLADEYKTVAVGISRAEKELEKLNAQQKKELNIEERRKRLRGMSSTAAKRFMGSAHTGGKAIGHTLSGAAHGIMGIGKWAAAGLIGGAAAAVASPIALNAETAETTGMAKSYGLSVPQYKAMGIMARQAGLNEENAGDLIENLTNKLKEQGNEKTLNPMLGQIGLLKSRLPKDRQAAFNLIMQRLSTMKDSGAAASLADQLMGGEANKFMTNLHSTGMSFEQAMKNAQKYNLLTQEGAEGAQKANIAVGNLWGVAITGMQDTVGKITGQLAPALDDAALQLAGWFKLEQPKITQAVADWLKEDKSGETGPERLWDNVVKLGKGLGFLADELMVVAEKLKWIVPDKSEDQKTVLKTLAQTGSEEIAAKVAHKEGLDDWFNENVRWNKSLFQQVQDEYTSTRGVIFDDDDAYDNFMDYSLNYTNGEQAPDQPMGPDGAVVPFNSRQAKGDTTNHNVFNLNITLSPGTATDMAQELHDEVQRIFGGGGFSPTVDYSGG
ncbi:hypothetical protein FNI11_13550 [Salmonella enterica subsp. salamae]|nr:hypothetical protein [Salmonella enterica subsp. salamae]ECJ2281377.1 hypothetical protein [Salmonella enterica subsp. salamae]